MRPALIGLATIAAAVAADVQAASAQNESFFQERYCARIPDRYFGGVMLMGSMSPTRSNGSSRTCASSISTERRRTR
jgi:hypothetical protein